MIKELSTNPREWTKKDVESVKDYCLSQGGTCTLFPPTKDNESDTYCTIEEDGAINVWFFQGKTRFDFRFRL